jgi:hypothetical protein
LTLDDIKQKINPENGFSRASLFCTSNIQKKEGVCPLNFALVMDFVKSDDSEYEQSRGPQALVWDNYLSTGNSRDRSIHPFPGKRETEEWGKESHAQEKGTGFGGVWFVIEGPTKTRILYAQP